MEDNRLNKIIFLRDVELCRNNWSSEFYLLCEKLDILNLFHHKQYIAINHVKQKMTSLIQREWFNAVRAKPKLRTYALFKTSFGAEPHLVEYMAKGRRSLMSQFRCGILPLEIEIGRHRGKAIYERTCHFCPNLVEDETHFLLHCSLYANLRREFFENIFVYNPAFQLLSDSDKLTYLITHHARLTANFIFNIWKIRQNRLFN